MAERPEAEAGANDAVEHHPQGCDALPLHAARVVDGEQRYRKKNKNCFTMGHKW